MRTYWGFTSSGLAALALCAGCTPSPEARVARLEATIDRYCFACHNAVDREGDLELESVDLNDVAPHAETLERVVRQLDGRVMPPPDEPRPDERTYDAAIELLERSLDEAAAERPYAGPALGGTELAARLAGFLWSGTADAELTALAEQGRLSEPAVYAAQVRRMLNDPRASALVARLATEWLGLGELEHAQPDADTAPRFDEGLRRAMYRETELFVESVMREDRSVLELMTADYTYINERLAKHYELEGVYGGYFRRYRYRDEHRRGLLGHASISALSSYPRPASPGRRGDWALERLLGVPVEGPAALREAIAERPERFVRVVVERLLAHALGRELAHRERPVVRRIVREAAAYDYRFSVLIDGIVTSRPFRTAGDPQPRSSR